MIDVSFFDWKLLLIPGFVVTIALTAAIAAADPRIGSVRVRILPILLLSVAYGMGVAAMADVVLDHSRPQLFQTEVLHKYVSTGRHTTRYLRLAPWGPQQQITEVGVASSLYVSLQPGQIVCVYFFPGAIKIPWYEVGHCPATPTRPSTSTSSLSANCPLNPRAEIAQLLALICATSSPGTMRSKSGMFRAPDLRMSSCVITNSAAGTSESFCSFFDADVTSTFIKSSRLVLIRSFGGV